MEKFIENAFFLFSCINPCITPPLPYLQPHVSVEYMYEFAMNSFFDDFNSLYTATQSCSSLQPHNRQHLIDFQKIINQFKNKLDNLSLEQEKSCNLMPALKKLAEALEADNLIWKRYFNNNKTVSHFFTKHCALIQQLNNHIIKKN